MQKIILVTGASKGFGHDAAVTLAAEGHRVFATMRRSTGRNEAAADMLAARGIEVVELDVTDGASVDRAFEALLKTTGGRLDVVVNNAGTFLSGLSESWSAEQVRDMFEVNVFGVQRVMRAALPAMRARGSGLIVNIGSILGRVTIPFIGLYGATKHAVEAMTESYRYELSQLGIDVVLVQPSAYPTHLYADNLQAAHAAVADGYGEIAKLPGAFAQYLEGLFGGSDRPDPHDVTKALVDLVALPAGRRPARVVVGNGFGADAVNAAVAPIQSQLVEAIGFGALARAKA